MTKIVGVLFATHTERSTKVLSSAINKKPTWCPAECHEVMLQRTEQSQTPSQGQRNARFGMSVHSHSQGSRRRLRSRHLQNLETLNSVEKTVVFGVTRRGKQLWGCR